MKGARWMVALAALAVAAVSAVGATAGSSSEERAVFYQLTAKFGVGLDAKWSWDEGDQSSCPWTHREGTWEVDGGSVNALPGSFSTDPKVASKSWAYLSAIGKAKVQVKRTLVQVGKEPRPTGTGCRNTTFPATDCGRKEYTSRAATLVAETRPSLQSLEDVVGASTSSFRYPAISISVPPLAGGLYRSCELPYFIPAVAGTPGNFGLIVASDLIRLRRLKPGRNVRVDLRPADRKGPCLKELPERVTCTYALDLFVVIHRLTKKEILDAAKKGR